MGKGLGKSRLTFGTLQDRNGLRLFIRVSIMALMWRFWSSIRHASSHIEIYRILVIANKIDENQKATTIKFGFPAKHGLYMNYTSAADGRNVVKVFHDALRAGVKYKKDTSLHSFSEMITQELADWDDSDEDES